MNVFALMLLMAGLLSYWVGSSVVDCDVYWYYSDVMYHVFFFATNIKDKSI